MKKRDILGCWMCDVFPLSFPTQEKQIINSPVGHNTQME